MKGIDGGRGLGDLAVKLIMDQRGFLLTVSVREKPAGLSLGSDLPLLQLSGQPAEQCAGKDQLLSQTSAICWFGSSVHLSQPEAAGPQQFHLCQVETGSVR